MHRARNNDASLRIWLKIALLALLLGSSGAAIGPGSFPLPSRSGGSGEPALTGGFQLIIQNEGSPILYEGRGFLPPNRSGEP